MLVGDYLCSVSVCVLVDCDVLELGLVDFYWLVEFDLGLVVYFLCCMIMCVLVNE